MGTKVTTEGGYFSTPASSVTEQCRLALPGPLHTSSQTLIYVKFPIFQRNVEMSMTMTAKSGTDVGFICEALSLWLRMP